MIRTTIRMIRPGRAGLVLLLAVLALAGVVVARPPHAPPLYDGLGFPDEPYRWVVPPSGAGRALLPTDAEVRVPVRSGTSGAAQALSGEQGPQVAVAVRDGALAAPDGATTISLHAIPRPVPATPPDRGQVVSNLYDITATVGNRAVPLAPGKTVLVNLRAESFTTRAVVICRWTGSGWEQVPTQQIGRDIYAAQLAALGPVAVVRLDAGVRPTVSPLGPPTGAAAGTSAAPAATTTTNGPDASLLLLVLGGAVVLLATALLVLRRRTQPRTPGADPEDDA
jgi:hypothetical protein